MTEQTIVEEDFTLLPTILLRLGPESMEVVTVPRGDEEALVVFRGPEDAAAYQEFSGKHTGEEGFERVGMYEEAVAAVLEKHSLEWVLLAAPSGSGEEGSLFKARDFIRFLEECRPPTNERRSMNAMQDEHGALIWTLMHDIFDHLGDEQRDHFTADLEWDLYPGEMVAELRAAAHLVEGLCVAAEGVNLVTLLVASDCRERVRRALRYAEAAKERAEA